MGLDVYIHYPDTIESGTKSKKYPDHMCDLTYLRSSYNSGGFNSVVGKLLNGKELYYIFGIDFGSIEEAPGYVPYDEETEEGGEWYPPVEHLEECLVRAREVSNELNAISRPLRTLDVTHYDNTAPLTAEQAIKLVYEKLNEYEAKPDEQKNWGGCFTSNQGFFNLSKDEPFNVVALIPGKSILGSPCTHVVFDDPGFDHYTQMAEIVVEMLETMIEHPGCAISWSS